MDHYRHKLKHAAWTWREQSVSPYHKSPRFRKDRASGRSDKRAARQDEREEIGQELVEIDQDPLWWDW